MSEPIAVKTVSTAPVLKNLVKKVGPPKEPKRLSHENPGDHESLSFIPKSVDAKVERCPSIIVSKSAYDDMRLLVDECDIEVGWMGLVEKTAEGFYISEIFVPKQKCHEARTRFDDGAMFDIIRDLKKRKIDPSGLRLWGHSHVWWDPDPSNDDWRQIDEFSNSDWMLTAIANKQGSIKFQAHFYEHGITIGDVPWSIPADPLEDSLREQTRQTILDKVGILGRPPVKVGHRSTGGSTGGTRATEFMDSFGHWDRDAYEAERFAEAMGDGFDAEYPYH